MKFKHNSLCACLLAGFMLFTAYADTSPNNRVNKGKKNVIAPASVSKALILADSEADLTPLTAAAPIVLVKTGDKCPCWYYYNSGWKKITVGFQNVDPPMLLTDGVLSTNVMSASPVTISGTNPLVIGISDATGSTRGAMTAAQAAKLASYPDDPSGFVLTSDTRLTNARTPTAHASTHTAVGSDPVSLDQTQINGLAAALAGKVGTSDPRLSDARTPTAHATSHATGGTDVVTLAESQVTNLVSDLAGKAALVHTHTASQITDFSAAADARITAQKAAANGLASLDSGTRLPVAQLPTTAVQTTDTGTVTNGMLAGSIANTKLANSAITINGSPVSLGGSITVGAGGTVTSVGLTSTDFAVSGSPVTTSGNITANLNTVGTAGTYSGVTTDSKGRVTAGTTRSFATPTRSLNSAFQIGSRDAFASYSVDVGASITLTAGSTGTVILEYADDSGFTTNVVTAQSSANGNQGTLTIGLNLTQTTTANVTAIIPANKFVRLRTVNTAGTPSFTFRAAQEVLL